MSTRSPDGVCLRDGSPAFGHGIARENRGAFETLERLRLESEHRRERPVESGQARLANRSRCLMRVEELRQLRVGVLEVPASHVTIIAGEHPAVACRECFGRIRSCVQRKHGLYSREVRELLADNRRRRRELRALLRQTSKI
jgi:hypothetical protein